ncbi:MAG: monovalent cation/H(+) antiporter subunit G [Acidimicrobiia bacterium]|nr:monovalent cation/H(+) antiporter subunit G [Acidimicrobiia bacterium]
MIGELLMLLGSGFVLLAALGVVRFHDALARMHALAKASTLGAVLIFGGAVLELHDIEDITSVVLAGVLHVMVSPPASNMMSRAAYLAGAMVHGPDTIDEGAHTLGVVDHTPDEDLY